MPEVWVVCLPALRVGPELVDQPSAEHGLKDFAFVVIPHGAAEFLVRHLSVSLPRAPSFRDFVALDEPEFRLRIIFPAD